MKGVFSAFGCLIHSRTFFQIDGSAQLPTYATLRSAGADFTCAEEVTIPSIWKNVLEWIKHPKAEKTPFKPTLVHTGIKAYMPANEVLKIYNRSSGPKKGLILANSVGIIDADYADNKDNDGEIMFAFFNILPVDLTIKIGDKIGQGIFIPFTRPYDFDDLVLEKERTGGFGSTDKQHLLFGDEHENVTSLRQRMNQMHQELDFPNSEVQKNKPKKGPDFEPMC